MTLRALVIDDNARAIVARVRAHAEANHSHPSPLAMTPGDDPRFVARLGAYRRGQIGWSTSIGTSTASSSRSRSRQMWHGS